MSHSPSVKEDGRIKKMEVPSSLAEKFEAELKEFNQNLENIQKEYTKNVTRLPCKFKIFTKYSRDELMRLAFAEFIERKKAEFVTISVSLQVEDHHLEDFDPDDYWSEPTSYWYELDCQKRKKCRCVDCGCIMEDE